jgi:hypothetical protein
MMLVLSIGVGVLLLVVFFKVFFHDWDDFGECVRYVMTPNWLSAFRGEWNEDQWAELKFLAYIALAAGGACLTYFGLQRIWT